jgi:hypothetical protein
MTQQKEDTAIRTIFEIINSDGMEGLVDTVSILINEAMKVERSSALNAQPWQRTENRMGYANGFKNKELWLVERVFRDVKSLLDTRPVCHQK